MSVRSCAKLALEYMTGPGGKSENKAILDAISYFERSGMCYSFGAVATQLSYLKPKPTKKVSRVPSTKRTYLRMFHNGLVGVYLDGKLFRTVTEAEAQDTYPGLEIN